MGAHTKVKVKRGEVMCNCKTGVVCEECLERNKAVHKGATVPTDRALKAAQDVRRSLDTTEQVRKLREALEPFATFAENYVDPEGWNDVGISASHERIVDWFGPSDFRQARTLAESEVEAAKEASDEWEVVLQKRITELKRQLAADDLAFGHANTVIKKYMDDLSPSPCGVKGHYKVDWTDWTERRAGERRGNAVPGIEDRRKYGSGGSWLERRITSLGGHCGRCEEVEQATDTALIGAEKGVSVIIDNTIEKAVTEVLEAAVVRFEFVALEYCERRKVMPKQFIDKGTAAIRGKGGEGMSGLILTLAIVAIYFSIFRYKLERHNDKTIEWLKKEKKP